MNARQIRELRTKFIRSAMFSIALAMLFIGITVNIATNILTSVSIDRLLRSLLESAEELDDHVFALKENVTIADIFLPQYDRNACYVLTYDRFDRLTSIHSNVNDEAETIFVRKCAEEVLHGKRASGQNRSYYYRIAQLSDGQTAVALLESSLIIATSLRAIYLTLLLGGFGLILTYFLVRHYSGQAIQPEIENAMRQKQFITNASHELKTPLAVIRANTDMIELTSGETEWTQSTINQVDRLNGLIQNLVMITKAQEQEDRSILTEVNASKLVSESIDPYEPMAAKNGISIDRKIEPDLMFTADESKLRQLATILTDNAMKYCDEGGTVSIFLTKLKGGKGLQLIVSNDYADGANIDCSRFFDRFYREDESRNIDKGGYGIGLSIAESICRQYDGSIKADWKNGIIRFVCVLR